MNSWDQPIIVNSDSHRPPPAEWCAVFRALMRYVPSERPLWEFFAQRCPEAQVFSFGQVLDDKLQEEALRGGEFWCAGHLRMPFRTTIYWYDHIRAVPGDVDERVRFATVCTELDAAVVGEGSWKEPLVAVCDFMGVPGQGVDGMRSSYMLTGAGIFGADRADPDNWRGKLLYTVDDKLPEETLPRSQRPDTQHQMGSLVDGVVGLSMILSTRGIPTRHEDAPHRLNAKRARTGKHPLPAVTHVDTRRYYEALSNSAGGTHASPVPHLRRGHLRRYSDGHTVWIRDVLVNCRSLADLKPRDHYEVDHRDAC